MKYSEVVSMDFFNGVNSFREFGAAYLVSADYITRTEFSGAIWPTLIPR